VFVKDEGCFNYVCWCELTSHHPHRHVIFGTLNALDISIAICLFFNSNIIVVNLSLMFVALVQWSYSLYVILNLRLLYIAGNLIRVLVSKTARHDSVNRLGERWNQWASRLILSGTV
jgi:hypothetical protein